MSNPDSPRPPGFTIGYDLGTVGAWVRILIGVIASMALLVIDLSDVGRGFLIDTALWFVAILAVYSVAYISMSSRVLSRINPWVSTVIFYGPVLVLPYMEALPATFRVALSLYVTVSIAVVVLVRYGGCEVVGIPSLIVQRRHVVYCPWNTVDLVDKAIEDSPWSGTVQGAGFKTVAVVVMTAVVIVGALVLDQAFPLVWLVVAAVAVLMVAAAVVVGRSSQKSPELR